MQKAVIRHYLSEWGRLKRIDWNPRVGFRAVSPGFDSCRAAEPPSVDDDMMNRIRKAMGVMERNHRRYYDVLSGVYFRQLGVPDLANNLSVSKSMVRQLRQQGESMLEFRLSEI